MYKQIIKNYEKELETMMEKFEAETDTEKRMYMWWDIEKIEDILRSYRFSQKTYEVCKE